MGGESSKQLIWSSHCLVIIFQQTAELYDIEAYPTFVFIKNKKQIQEVFIKYLLVYSLIN